MPSLNHVFLMGNLTRDPEVRYAPSGDAVADMHLAVSRKYKTRDGQDHEETCFIGVAAWGRTAENCGKYLHKGSPVFVEGRLKYDQWEKDGKKNSRITVTAQRVQFLGGRSEEGGSQPAAARGGQQQSEERFGTAPVAGPQDEQGGDDDNLPF